ncbi:MAG TPA: FoF1 ATP synthase subunit a [Anaerolineales bacterium]
MSEAKPKKRFGVKRWIILAIFAVGIYAAFIGPSILKPVSPPVVMPAENTGLHIGGFQITNSILATLLVDVLLILMALSVYRFIKSGKMVPSGFFNIFEAIFEFMWNSVEGAAGKWAKRIIPIPATIFLLIFVANMVKLVPGFESIGLVEPSITGKGYAPVKLFHVGKLDVYTIDKSQPVNVPASTGETNTTQAETASTAHEGICSSCDIIPFLRGPSTDLNFPLALAVITIVMVQVYGVISVGPGYFSKFLPVKQLVSGGIFGLINFAVGILEIILEFAKVLSFTFRLFGNIFAGVILLSILGALLPVILPPGLYLFEIFFGAIQAYVFFLLATIFISSATTAHHSEG